MSADATGRFWGAALQAVGVLVAGLGGLCTLSGVLLGFAYPSDALMLILTSLFVGALPILIGVGLFWWGRTLRRPKRIPRRPPVVLGEDEP